MSVGLRELGLSSIGSGETTPGIAIGYDLDLDMDDNDADLRVRDYLFGEHRTPFFIDCGFMQTHRPWLEPLPQDDPTRC